MVTNKPMIYLTAQVRLKSTKSSFAKDVLNLKSMQRPLTLSTPTHVRTHTYLWFRQRLFNSVEGLAVVSLPA